jgi:hypothetical protein
MLVNPPFVPTFGVGNPPANVPINQLYYDTTTTPYIPWVFDPIVGAWEVYGGTGGGTVSSVGLTAPSIFTVSGSPVTSAGILAMTLTAQTQNTVFSGPASAPSAAPTFRALVNADIPTLTSKSLVSCAISGGTTIPNGLITSAGLVGIGNGGASTPVSPLNVVQNGGTNKIASWDFFGATAVGGPLQDFRKARGTMVTPTAVLNNDYIGTTQFQGYGGSSFIISSGFGSRVNGTVTSSSVPTDLFFYTSGGANETDPYSHGTVRLILAANGNVAVGQITPATKLDVDGPIGTKTYLVAALPVATGKAGMLAFVSDATLTAITGLGLTVIGGGSNFVPVYSDGTNWIIL